MTVHSDRLTEQELQDIRERCEKASAGPWRSFTPRSSRTVAVGNDGTTDAIVHWMGFDACDVSVTQQRANARFIAAARSDIPKLLSELSRLRSERVTLAKDSERLDFIERAGLAHAADSGWDEDVVSVERFTDDEEPSQEWSVIGGKCLDGIGTAIGQGPSLRAAIDKAKALSRPPEGP